MSIHVDDTQMTDPNSEKLDWAQAEIVKHFEIKDVGNSDHYLGMKINQTEEGIKLSQSLYVKELLRDFEMEGCNPVQTPMDSGFNGKIDFSKDLNYTDEFTKQAY